MGTDIHGVLQSRYRSERTWWTDCRIEDDRNYSLFAALADVRNGRGFAGVPIFVPITPISEPRGWPEDFDLKRASSLLFDGEDDHWLGDHSFSWLSVSEVVNWDGWDQSLNECGYISREQYEKWDHVSPPSDGWCGDTSGRGVIKAEDGQPPPEGWTHIRVYWSRPLRDDCSTFLAWLEYARLKTAGMEARIVFGFDS